MRDDDRYEGTILGQRLRVQNLCRDWRGRPLLGALAEAGEVPAHEHRGVAVVGLSRDVDAGLSIEAEIKVEESDVAEG